MATGIAESAQQTTSSNTTKTFGQFLSELHPSCKTLVRKKERILQKINRLENSIVFNNCCIQEGLLPKYTMFKLHDPAAKRDHNTTEFRKQLIQRQITTAKEEIQHLDMEKRTLENLLKNKLDIETLTTTENYLEKIIAKNNIQHRLKITKKLCNLYNGDILLPSTKDRYINLSDHELTNNQKELLNLGPNVHIQTTYDPLKKKAELEMLYQSIIQLESDEKVKVQADLRDLLRVEGIKNRSTRNKIPILTKPLKQAAKELKSHPDVIVRRADKSNMFVILNKSDYNKKIQDILNDQSKFKRLKSNPTEKLKKSLNAIITANNAEKDALHISKIIGDYRPGYIYGNVKTHKVSNPLRPIISQIPTPVYHLSKKLNSIISPYIPTRYSVNSTDEFLHILNSVYPNKGTLASLDVESLFTNVPVEETIDIILNYVYKNKHLPSPKIKPNTLKKLLTACTTEVPFVCPSGNIYTQINGVSMGSALGPTFAEFYMAHMENNIFENNPKPILYVRYVDDILILTNDIGEVFLLKNKFETNSILNFTIEVNQNNKIPFLDVLVDNNEDRYVTAPYKKPTCESSCLLNYRSECPERYKIAVIKNFINRAKKISSSHLIFYKELSNIKQTLVNNGFPNYVVDRQIKLALSALPPNLNTSAHNDSNNNESQNRGNSNRIDIFYCGQYHPNYKIDETILRDIVYQNIIPVNPDSEMNFVIYYRKFKTHNLLIKNSPDAPEAANMANVVYEFKCKIGSCASSNNNYIGMTRTSLRRRLSMHICGNSSSVAHHLDSHRLPADKARQILFECTHIIRSTQCVRRLPVFEALLIKDLKPTLNKINFEQGHNILKLFNN